MERQAGREGIKAVKQGRTLREAVQQQSGRQLSPQQNSEGRKMGLRGEQATQQWTYQAPSPY